MSKFIVKIVRPCTTDCVSPSNMDYTRQYCCKLYRYVSRGSPTGLCERHPKLSAYKALYERPVVWNSSTVGCGRCYQQYSGYCLHSIYCTYGPLRAPPTAYSRRISYYCREYDFITLSYIKQLNNILFAHFT
jgi:hypothetical protein